MNKTTEYYNTLMGKTKKVLSNVDWNKKYLGVISKLDKLLDTLIDLQAQKRLNEITIALNNIWDAKELLEKYKL